MNSQINDWKKKPKEQRKKCCLVLIFYYNFVYELCGVEGLLIGGNVVHTSFCVKGFWEKAEPKPKVEEEKEEACFLICFNFTYSLLCSISHSSLYLKILGNLNQSMKTNLSLPVLALLPQSIPSIFSMTKMTLMTRFPFLILLLLLFIFIYLFIYYYYYYYYFFFFAFENILSLYDCMLTNGIVFLFFALGFRMHLTRCNWEGGKRSIILFVVFLKHVIV